MNINSKICCFIEENKDDWKDILVNNYNIKVKEEYPYIIFNYDIFADFSDPIVQEARGIIIDVRDLSPVCWPFRKFGNFDESYADEIDWSTAVVQEKLDGSIIKLWWNKYNNRWNFSTNSMINAYDAIANITTGESFIEIIESADNFQDLQDEIINNRLDKNNTYIFELVGPKNQIVIKYKRTHLYHIGTRNNITGLESDICIGIERPKVYYIGGKLDNCIKATEELNKNKSDIKHEGFVVVDKYWNRIKIKSPEYLMLHRLSSNSNFSKKRIIQLIRNREISVQEMSENFPDFAHYFKYYDFKITEFEYKAKIFVNLTHNIYKEYNHDRKIVANIIKNHPFAAIGFTSLDTNKTAEEILQEMSINKYEKYIPEYQPEKLSKLFYQDRKE